MKFLLQRKRSGNTVASGEGAAKNASSFSIRLQTLLAKLMKRNTESFTKRNWILLLALSVLITCGYNTYLVLSNFSDKGKKSFVVMPIRKPGYLTKTGDPKAKVLPAFKAEYQRIHNFRRYIDNLAGSSAGKVIYDSITHCRPGLMDSIRYIDNYYRKLKDE